MSHIEGTTIRHYADELDNEKQFEDELDSEHQLQGDDDRSKRMAEGKKAWNHKKKSQQLNKFTEHCKLIAEYLVHYNNTVVQRKVFPAMSPGYLRPKYEKRGLQDKPKSVEYLMNSFDKRIMPGICHWKHPLFLAYFPAGGAYSQVLGDMLSTGCGGVGATWAQQPALTELECVMMDWLAEALHLPDHFKFEPENKTDQLQGGGMTVGSASDAIHNVLLAARFNYLNDNPKTTLESLVAYTSSETHSSTVKAAQLALVYMKLLYPEKGDKSGTITGKIFQAALDEDTELKPFFMCASVGTTGGCSVDNLREIGEICKEKMIYLHVDAAYAGSAFVSDKFQDLLFGMDYADSLDINPYKFMLASPDLACLWVRDMQKFSRAFDPNYGLMEKDANQPKYLINFQSYGIPATRRMRALKLWALFQNYGRDALAAYIERLSECAKYFETLVSKNSKFEIMNVRRLALVCFRQAELQQNRSGKPEKEDTLVDKQNRNLITRLNATNKMHIVGSYFDAHYGLRFSVNYEYITNAHIDEAWQLIKDNYVTDLDVVDNQTRSSPLEMQAILDRNNYYFVSPEEFIRMRNTNRIHSDGFGRVPIPKDESSVNMLSFFAKKLAKDIREQEAAMNAAIEKDDKAQKDDEDSKGKKDTKDKKDKKGKKPARKGNLVGLTDDEDEYYDDE